MRIDRQPDSEELQPIQLSFFRSLRRNTHWKCLILTLLVCGCLAAIVWCRVTVVKREVVNYYVMYANDVSDDVAATMNQSSPCADSYVYIPVAFLVLLYLVYLVECWHSHTRIELQLKVDVRTVYDYIDALHDAVPIVWWKAVCYHYVRRTRQVTRYRNGDAFTATQVYYERVNSHSASLAFNFTYCGVKDISPSVVRLENFPATKIRFSKGFSFANLESEREFEQQRAAFFDEYERRDDYVEVREGLDLLNVNFRPSMIAFTDRDHLPWYVSQAIFWVLSALLLSWPLRVLIEYKTAHLQYHAHKIFGLNYTDPWYDADVGERMTRTGSSDTDAELDIARNNFTIVPSYSEALLMDTARNSSRTPSRGNISSSASIPRRLGSLLATSILPRAFSYGHVADARDSRLRNGTTSLPRSRTSGFISRFTESQRRLAETRPLENGGDCRRYGSTNGGFSDSREVDAAASSAHVSLLRPPGGAVRLQTRDVDVVTRNRPNGDLAVNGRPKPNTNSHRHGAADATRVNVDRQSSCRAGGRAGTSARHAGDDVAVVAVDDADSPPCYEDALTMRLLPLAGTFIARYIWGNADVPRTHRNPGRVNGRNPKIKETAL